MIGCFERFFSALMSKGAPLQNLISGVHLNRGCRGHEELLLMGNIGPYIYIVITGFKTLKFDLHFAHELSVEAWGTSCFRYQMPANFRSFEKVVEARRGLHPSGNPAELTFDGWLADIALS